MHFAFFVIDLFIFSIIDLFVTSVCWGVFVHYEVNQGKGCYTIIPVSTRHQCYYTVVPVDTYGSIYMSIFQHYARGTLPMVLCLWYFAHVPIRYCHSIMFIYACFTRA